MVMHHLMQAPSHPVGGSGEIARSIVPVIQEAGGQVLVNAKVAAILTTPDGSTVTGVQMESGEKVLAPIVISDAGVYNTYSRMLNGAARVRCDSVNVCNGVWGKHLYIAGAQKLQHITMCILVGAIHTALDSCKHARTFA